MSEDKMVEPDPEITAMSAVHNALKGLDPDVQARVLHWVALKLKVASTEKEEPPVPKGSPNSDDGIESHAAGNETHAEELDGISPVAKKWITRSGLDPKALGDLFSLGGDEIDLIAKKVPGNSKKERMHSVFLLKGIAAYLATGAARVVHDQIKEACLHYDAFDSPNFAANLKRMSSDISGSKDTGYQLTNRGMAAATDLVKELTKKN